MYSFFERGLVINCYIVETLMSQLPKEMPWIVIVFPRSFEDYCIFLPNLYQILFLLRL